jgi:hypothetical protein
VGERVRVRESERETWEVLRDESLHSYSIAANAKYKKALASNAPTFVMTRAKSRKAKRAAVGVADMV